MSDTTPDTVWDYLIQGAKVFDGIGELPVREDIAIADGRVAARGPDLDPQKAHKVIDATERWAMPGLFDIHTHYDLELEVAPGLPESVRHGTTTVVIANCSLGLAFGAQRKDGADPIVDCYARVENIPKDVLRATADRVDWKNPKEYIQHLNRLSLGPNLVTMVPHSMLRIEVMGFDASISRDPTEDELNAMEALLEQAMDDGYAGFSTDALPFHYLANQPNTRKTIPTQFAKYPEIKRLTDVVRRKGGV
ncbi:MAG: amidohydrolase family protein [Marinobacter sp.]